MAHYGTRIEVYPQQDLDFTYPGGKGGSGVAEWIIRHMPVHAYYYEPFAGKAAVYRKKPPALESVLIDLDRNVCDWLDVLTGPSCIVKCDDGLRWFAENAQLLFSEDLVYLDPPYVLETRTKKKIYRFEFGSGDHQDLLAAARLATCNVMLSGYRSDLYDQELRDWHRVDMQAMTRGGVRTECLWMNFDPGTVSPGITMEYSVLGVNYRERERINRKIRRWQANLRKMPAHERNAVLRSLVEEGQRDAIVHRHV